MVLLAVAVMMTAMATAMQWNGDGQVWKQQGEDGCVLLRGVPHPLRHSLPSPMSLCIYHQRYSAYINNPILHLGKPQRLKSSQNSLRVVFSSEIIIGCLNNFTFWAKTERRQVEPSFWEEKSKSDRAAICLSWVGSLNRYRSNTWTAYNIFLSNVQYVPRSEIQVLL